MRPLASLPSKYMEFDLLRLSRFPKGRRTGRTFRSPQPGERFGADPVDDLSREDGDRGDVAVAHVGGEGNTNRRLCLLGFCRCGRDSGSVGSVGRGAGRRGCPTACKLRYGKDRSVTPTTRHCRQTRHRDLHGPSSRTHPRSASCERAAPPSLARTLERNGPGFACLWLDSKARGVSNQAHSSDLREPQRDHSSPPISAGGVPARARSLLHWSAASGVTGGTSDSTRQPTPSGRSHQHCHILTRTSA